MTVIFQAVVVSRVSYALPAWYGHLGLLQADIGRINALFRKAHWWQLTDRTFTIEELGAKADIKLSKAIVGSCSPFVPIMARYSLFVLKVPLNPKQTNKFCTNYLHTDQFNIHYENGVTCSFYPPQVQHTSEQHS